MYQEPVAWRWRRGPDTRWHLASSGDLAGEVEPLYRHAQQPVVPEALQSLRTIVANPRRLPRRKEWIGGQQYSYVLLEEVEALIEDAYRAAMLQAGNSPVIPDGSAVAALTGIPMIPDGYVMVPKEPTPEILAVITEAIKSMRGSAATYARVLAAAPQPQNAPQNIPEIIPGWIPVSERLPEREVDVQVYCTETKEQMVAYLERKEREGYFRFATWRTGDGIYCQPTHWMPLPAAPQEEPDGK
ncbi:hypothetical protein DOD04_27220 [Klebsiella michiganensis]|nr:hypothetical protein DOD04_27220 [Klebsiella michiganensis]